MDLGESTDGARREQELWSLIRAGDIDGFAGQLLDGGIFIDGCDVQTKDQLVVGLRAIQLLSFDLDDFTAVRPTPDTEIVAYRVRESIRSDAGTTERRTVASSVWVRRDEVWQLALHQEASVDA